MSLSINHHPHPDGETLRFGFARPQQLANVSIGSEKGDKRICFDMAIVLGLVPGRNKN